MRRAISAAFLALLFSAHAAEPVRSLLEIRHAGVVLQHWDVSCGAAALATVLTHSFSDPVSEQFAVRSMLQRTDALRVKVRGGFSLLDMKRFAESRGYTATGYRDLSLEELGEMSSPIVPIDEFGNPHFVVVRRVEARVVEIADPAFGNRSLGVERFQEVWRDGIGFVLSRRAP